MTKLMEWLVAITVFLSIWLAFVTNKIETEFTKQNINLVLASPIIFLGLFGLYAATVVLYRSFTFNNCEEAALELHKEIDTAKKDLKSKGYVF